LDWPNVRPELKEIVMAKVSAYHSVSPEDMQRQRYVHHDHDDCADGKRIKLQNKLAGTGGYPRCDECIRLG
jgi:hypothetical protein